MLRSLLKNSAIKYSDIFFNTSSLIATMLITSALGFAYWWVAARLYSPEAVGLASAATSAMMLLSTLFLLGQGTLLLTELPRNKGLEGSLISASLLLVGISTLIASLLFALLAPYISPQLAALGTTPQSILLFALGASLASITVLLDQAVIGLLQGGIQLWRNTAFSTCKTGVSCYRSTLSSTNKRHESLYNLDHWQCHLPLSHSHLSHTQEKMLAQLLQTTVEYDAPFRSSITPAS